MVQALFLTFTGGDRMEILYADDKAYKIATPNEIRETCGLNPIDIRKNVHPRKTNCLNCGAVIGMIGKCEYCGTIVGIKEDWIYDKH